MADEEKAVDGRPSWMLGEGFDTDMTGDPNPGAGGFVHFWMPKGSERKIIFLTEGDKFKVIWEHQCQLGGKWGNFFTCLAMMGAECPMCHAAEAIGKFQRYKIAYGTCIDTHEFKTKDGKTKKDMKKLFGVKKDAMELLKRQYLKRLEADQGLRGALYDVYRTNSDKSPSSGEQFDFCKMIDLASLPDSTEMDYADLLAPSPSKIKAAAERVLREHGGSSALSGAGKTEGTDASVKF